MPQSYRFLLHSNGPAMWPEHKPLEEVLEIERTTSPYVWQTTYQQRVQSPEGSTFKRDWWDGKNRYNIGDKKIKNRVVARWLSWDTALVNTPGAAYTSAVVGELWPDYRIGIRYVYRERLEFPELPNAISRLAMAYNYDDKLRGVIIEDKVSGTSAYQTLKKSAKPWLQDVLIAFITPGDKEFKAGQAALWCRNGCVMLPHPSPENDDWLFVFEDELFDFPHTNFKDQVDAFSQMIIYTENLLAEGWRAREG